MKKAVLFALIISACFFPVNAATGWVFDGLAAYWSMDGDLLDRSNFVDNHLRAHGTIQYTDNGGYYGKSIQCGLGKGYAESDGLVHFTDADYGIGQKANGVAVEANINLDQFNSVGSIINTKITSDGFKFGIGSNGEPYMSISGIEFKAGQLIARNKWYNVIFTIAECYKIEVVDHRARAVISHHRINIYVNGIMVLDTNYNSITIPWWSFSNYLTVGKDFSGKLDEVYVYSGWVGPDEAKRAQTSAFWSMDDLSPNGSYKDMSGHGNDLCLKDAVSVVGKFGSALDMGLPYRSTPIPYCTVKSSESLKIGTSMTFVAYVMWNTTPSGYQTFIMKGNWAPGSINYIFGAHNDQLKFSYHDGVWHDFITDPEGAFHGKPNIWYQIAIVVNRQTKWVKFYSNGEFLCEMYDPAGFHMPLNNDILTVGRNTRNDEVFYGRFDDMRLYNKALTDAEVKELVGHGIISGYLAKGKDPAPVLDDKEVPEDLMVTPNPFNPSTRIYLPSINKINAKAAIYDLNGKQIDRLSLGDKKSIVWNAGELPSGVYILKLTSSNRTWTRRLILRK